jgi:hypothetical protein
VAGFSDEEAKLVYLEPNGYDIKTISLRGKTIAKNRKAKVEHYCVNIAPG